MFSENIIFFFLKTKKNWLSNTFYMFFIMEIFYIDGQINYYKIQWFSLRNFAFKRKVRPLLKLIKKIEVLHLKRQVFKTKSQKFVLFIKKRR